MTRTFLFFLAAALALAHGPAVAADTIKIGVIDTISGGFAQVGNDSINGAKLAVDEINRAGGVNGRKLELVIKDEQINPTATVQALRELQSAGVTMTMGYASSADCLAAVPISAQNNMLIFGSHCIANTLTKEKFDKHFFRVTANDAMINVAAAQFVHARFGSIATWDAYAPDYITGHDSWNLFQESLKKVSPYVRFGTATFVPLTAQDVRSYVSSLSSAVGQEPHHGLYLATFAATTVATVKQGKPLGLFNQFEATLNINGSEPTAAQLGADFPDVWFVYDYYYKAYTTKVNQHFVEAYQRAYKAPPNSWSYEGYTTILAIKAGAERAKSTDTDKMIAALEDLTFEGPKGKETFRASDHQLAQPVTVFNCVGSASEPQGFKCPRWSVVPANKVM